MRTKLLAGLFVGTLLASAAAWAADPVPGDACTPNGAFQRTGGAESSGVGNMMVCASGAWKAILGFDATANGTLPNALSLSGDISPTQITANQNDYNPAGLSTASVVRLSTDASRNITSLAGGGDGRIVTIMNVGSNPIVLKNDDGSTGTAGNRFALTGDLTLASNQSAILMYDSTALRWRQIANGTASGSGDNLGNHIATANIQLGSNWLSGDGGNEGIKVDAAGKVSIGSTGKQYMLDVIANHAGNSDGISVRNLAVDGFSEVNFGNDLGADKFAVGMEGSTIGGTAYLYAGANVGINFMTGGTQRMAITPQGHVEIGTTNFSDKLLVEVDDSSQGVSVENYSSSGGRYPHVAIYNYSGGFGGAPVLLFGASRGDSPTPAALQSGDRLGMIIAQGQYDAIPFARTEGAAISFIAGGTFDSSSAPTNIVFSTTAVGSYTDTERMRIDPSGNVGIGTNVPGTTLDNAGSTALSGDITPAQITANQNDFNPTGLSTASVLRLNSDAVRNITGLQGGADGRVITIFNVGSNNIVFKNQSSSSTAGNRFALGVDITIAADQSVAILYDSTSQRWRAAGLPFSVTNSVTKTPSQIFGSDLVAWYDASDASSITQSGGALSQWNDETSHGYNLAQATAGFQPTYSATGAINGKAAVTFDGSDDYLTASGISDVSAGVVAAFVVFTQGTSGVYSRMVTLTDHAQSFAYDNATSIELLYNVPISADRNFVSLSHAPITTSSSTINIVGSVFDGSYNTIYLDNYPASPLASSGALAANMDLHVGAGKGLETQGFGGRISEIVLTRVAPTAQQRLDLEMYFQSKWF